MMKIFGFEKFNFMEAQSVRALGIGASCYIGLKASQYNTKYAPHFGKGVLAVSAISTLYFAGLLEKEGFLYNYSGLGIPIPGLGVKVSFGLEPIKDLALKISTTTTDQIAKLSNYLREK